MLTYKDIIHGKNISIKAFIQSFTPKDILVDILVDFDTLVDFDLNFYKSCLCHVLCAVN